MNLYFRLFFIYIFSKFHTKKEIHEVCVTKFRVMPNDLDLLFHINNGRYFSLQDLARINFMRRTDFAKKVSKKGWYPVIVSEYLNFIRPLTLFQSYEISTKIIHYDEKYFYIAHEFIRKGERMAYGMVKTRFLDKKGGKISPSEILKLSSNDFSNQEFDYLRRYKEFENELKSRESIFEEK